MAQLQAQQRPTPGACPPGQQHAAAAAARWREGRRRQLAGACLQLPEHAQQQCSLVGRLSWQALPQGQVYRGSSSSGNSGGGGGHARQRRRLQPCAALPRIASLETEPATADRVPQYKMPKGVSSRAEFAVVELA